MLPTSCDIDLSGDMFTEEQNELVESAAEMLYGLIHVRYILTSKGMSAMVSLTFMKSKFLSNPSLCSDMKISIVGKVQKL